MTRDMKKTPTSVSRMYVSRATICVSLITPVLWVVPGPDLVRLLDGKDQRLPHIKPTPTIRDKAVSNTNMR